MDVSSSTFGDSSSSETSLGSPGSPPSTDPSLLIEESSEASALDGDDVAPVKASKRKLSRTNTAEEKRKMRKARNKRKRKQALRSRVEKLEKDLASAQNLMKVSVAKIKHYRQVSRTYWERWRWELEKRRESMIELRARKSHLPTNAKPQLRISHIDPEMIEDISVSGVPQQVYLGRGSFGIVRLQSYRGIDVAVKELLPRAMVADLMHEAQILASLCHPNLPYLFGVCTKSRPL